MGKFLIAVGGSGQDMALACLRLCHLAGDRVGLPITYVFDSDIAPARQDNEETTRYGALDSLARMAIRYRGTNDSILSLQEVYYPDQRVTTAGSLFRPFNAPHPQVDTALDLLLTKEQQKTTVTDGFHGKPPVGAVAFGDFSAQRLESFFEGNGQNGVGRLGLLAQIRNATTESHFIVLAGGTSGGTGTSVLPVLAPAIYERVVDQRKDLKRQGRDPDALTSSIVVQVPWFSLTNLKRNAEPDLEYPQMEANAACLMRFYGERLSDISDRMVMLGLSSPAERTSSGSNQQPEERHYLNVVSGWMVAQMMTRSPELQRMAQRGFYAFAMGYGDANGGQPSFDTILRDQLRLNFDSGIHSRSVDLKALLDATRVLVAFSADLRRQLQFPNEAALSPQVCALARQLSTGERQQFVTEMHEWEDLDRAILKWSSDSLRTGDKIFQPATGLGIFATSTDGPRRRDVERDEAQFLMGRDFRSGEIQPHPAHRLVATAIDAAGLLKEAKKFSGAPREQARQLHRVLRNHLVDQVAPNN